MHWFLKLWRWLFPLARPALPPAIAAAGDIYAQLAAARAAHHEGDPDAAAIIRDLSNELNLQLTDGAGDCPGCVGRPTGITQPTGIEIGCTTCHGRRAKAPTRGAAVEAWNACAYLPTRTQ